MRPKRKVPSWTPSQAFQLRSSLSVWPAESWRCLISAFQDRTEVADSTVLIIIPGPLDSDAMTF